MESIRQALTSTVAGLESHAIDYEIIVQGLPAGGDRPVQPLLSNHFNLTVEMPLKAFVRGPSFAVVPVTWTNREYGGFQAGPQGDGSRYVFTVLYVGSSIT